MTTTVIGLFKDASAARDARDAHEALKKQGLGEDSLQLFDRQDDGMTDVLGEFGIDEEDSQAFAGAVAKGAAVIAAECEGDKAQSILSLLQDKGAHAVDTYEESDDAGEAKGEPGRSGGGARATLPEVEESVEIGKRRVTRGGVRARTRVTERPVEKTVTLKEEQADVNRRDADRDISPEEADKAFQEKSVEVTENGEEANVRKAARLVGEVEVAKTESERQETVKDTARKSEVEVERAEAAPKGKR